MYLFGRATFLLRLLKGTRYQGAFGWHKWNGCKCTVCSKTRDEGHDFDENCICRICGQHHQWELESWHEEEEIIDATSLPDYNSSDNYGVVVKDVTIVNNYQCKNCGETKTEYEHKGIMPLNG